MRKHRFAAFCLTLTACGPFSEPPTPQASLKTVAFSHWNKRTIQTCWEFTSRKTLSFRNEIEKNVSRAFSNAVVHFTGWQQCAPDVPSDVKLFIYDDEGQFFNSLYRSYVEQLISENNGKKEGAGHPRLRDSNRPMRVVLNSTFKDAEAEFVTLYHQLTQQGRKNLALTASIHELGHVLGLRHEDAHPERTCDTFSEELDGALVVTSYNPFSFMSRCYYRTFNFNLGPILPNSRDIDGINTLYAEVTE
ncbi:MAG: Dual-action metallo-peptidase [Pseudomonadota bacterium]|jgi:hypothetical protein